MACSLNGKMPFLDVNKRIFSPKFSSLNESKRKSVLGSKSFKDWNFIACPKLSAQRSICVGKSMRWWEKAIQPNMVEIKSAQQFVDSLSNAGERLVIVDFYSPGCGGCKASHPKIKKFKDALAKHGTERFSNGPAKGLNESELLGLALIGQINLSSSLGSSTAMENLVSKTNGVASESSIGSNCLVASK